MHTCRESERVKNISEKTSSGLKRAGTVIKESGAAAGEKISSAAHALKVTIYIISVQKCWCEVSRCVIPDNGCTGLVWVPCGTCDRIEALPGTQYIYEAIIIQNYTLHSWFETVAIFTPESQLKWGTKWPILDLVRNIAMHGLPPPNTGSGQGIECGSLSS